MLHSKRAPRPSGCITYSVGRSNGWSFATRRSCLGGEAEYRRRQAAIADGSWHWTGSLRNAYCSNWNATSVPQQAGVLGVLRVSHRSAWDRTILGLQKWQDSSECKSAQDPRSQPEPESTSQGPLQGRGPHGQPKTRVRYIPGELYRQGTSCKCGESRGCEKTRNNSPNSLEEGGTLRPEQVDCENERLSFRVRRPCEANCQWRGSSWKRSGRRVRHTRMHSRKGSFPRVVPLPQPDNVMAQEVQIEASLVKEPTPDGKANASDMNQTELQRKPWQLALTRTTVTRTDGGTGRHGDRYQRCCASGYLYPLYTRLHRSIVYGKVAIGWPGANRMGCLRVAMGAGGHV